MNTLLENDVHRFNLNTLRLDKELESFKIDLLLMPGEIRKHAVVAAQWHTSMGPSVCPLCASLQGEIIPVDSAEWGRIFPPLHISCQCNLSYITADERGVVQRLEKYKPIDPDLLAKWSSKIYTDAEIREMAKTFKEVKPVTYEGTVDSESERILRAGLRTKNEHGVAIDAKGNVIMKRPGKSPDMVTLTPDDIEKMRIGKAKNFIHNHPGTSASSFSPDDLNFARTMDLDEMMVVGKKYKYTIKQGPRGWQTADLDEMGRLYDSAVKATTPKYEALYKADVMMDWEEMWARQTHEIIEGLSKKFGLVYKRSVL